MPRNKRKLIKVTDDAELRTGMIMVLKFCKACKAGDHEFMLGVPNKEPHIHDGEMGQCSHTPLWNLLSPTCGDYYLECFSLAIPQGRLFRVEDGMDDEIAKEKKQKRIAKALSMNSWKE